MTQDQFVSAAHEASSPLNYIPVALLFPASLVSY